MKKAAKSKDKIRRRPWLAGGGDAAALLALGLVLVAAAWAMTRQWDKPLLDMHSFRQTQTAISAYYMAKDPWMFFNYITPVLGKPWAIPMEVPIFQWIVARWHNLSGMGLDQSGKLVSILFWAACLWPVWRLLALLDLSRWQRCAAGVLMYSSPLYLYWGRAFLIESTGLFLSLGMAACLLAGYKSRDWRWLAASLLLGTAAALCKVTTWAVAVGVAGLLVLFSEGLPKWRHRNALVIAGAVALLPAVPAKLWLAYGDSVKQLNPFAREIILSSSAKQRDWNFGTLEQKLDPATWGHIGRHITEQLLVPLPLLGPFGMVLVLIAGAILSPKRIPVVLIFLAGFASGPVIFTNLYFEHSYYWCANGVWLLLAVGVALAGIWECRPESLWPRGVAGGLAITLAVSGFVAWSGRFFPLLTALPAREQIAAAWSGPLQAIVPPERSILIVGQDWNPLALYYAERRGIAQPASKGIEFPGPEFYEALTLLGPNEKLGAIVFADPLLTPENQAPITSILQQLGMSRNGERTPFGVIFPALELQRTQPEN